MGRRGRSAMRMYAFLLNWAAMASESEWASQRGRGRPRPRPTTRAAARRRSRRRGTGRSSGARIRPHVAAPSWTCRACGPWRRGEASRRSSRAVLQLLERVQLAPAGCAGRVVPRPRRWCSGTTMPGDGDRRRRRGHPPGARRHRPRTSCAAGRAPARGRGRHRARGVPHRPAGVRAGHGHRETWPPSSSSWPSAARPRGAQSSLLLPHLDGEALRDAKRGRERDGLCARGCARARPDARREAAPRTLLTCWRSVFDITPLCGAGRCRRGRCCASDALPLVRRQRALSRRRPPGTSPTLRRRAAAHQRAADAHPAADLSPDPLRSSSPRRRPSSPSSRRAARAATARAQCVAELGERPCWLAPPPPAAMLGARLIALCARAPTVRMTLSRGARRRHRAVDDVSRQTLVLQCYRDALRFSKSADGDCPIRRPAPGQPKRDGRCGGDRVLRGGAGVWHRGRAARTAQDARPRVVARADREVRRIARLRSGALVRRRPL